MSKSQAPPVKSKLFLDWNFNADQSPFNEATTKEEVKTKQANIEEYVVSEVLKTDGSSWSVQFFWTVTDSISLVYNMKAYATQDGSQIEAAFTTLTTSGIGTPQPPPQPPPPTL